MNKLSPQKRNQLILVGVLSLLLVAALWYTLIRYQQNGLHRLASQREADEIRLAHIQETIKHSKQIRSDLEAVRRRLADQERFMAGGDPYSWMINFIRRFKEPYPVAIPQFSSDGEQPENLLPKFPYKQFSVTIGGTAYYSDLGRFVADFENRFPTCRLLNLDLAPASTSRASDNEKLAFRMNVVSLVRPPGTQVASTP